ncbi:hypothetical protein BY458DRAFT_487159 [Sporodiniella umbellata]|nr:hypothetical protein BY458DRAFT_487159 [Sporodiniella umbellata]
MLKGRKYCTGHYFPNGTIYILGGTESTDDNTTHHTFASALLLFYFNQSRLSLEPLAPSFNLLSASPSIGHTSHTLANGTLVSLFGLHPTTPPTSTSVGPSPRYGHTSLLVPPHLYLIGGLSAMTHQLTADAWWRYSIVDSVWTALPLATTRVKGHVSFQFRHWIVSCFGQRASGLSNDCLKFDTFTSHTTQIQATRATPIARQYASLVQVEDGYILHGGEDEEGRILGDVWRLKLGRSLKSLRWSRLEAAADQPRSGHVGIRLAENQILYYGGQSSSHTLANDPLYLNASSGKWQHQARLYSLATPALTSTGPSSGMIAGISLGVLGLLAVVGLLFFLFVQWRQKKRKRQSRVVRFQSSKPNSVKKAPTITVLPELTPAHLNNSHLSLSLPSSNLEPEKANKRRTLFSNPPELPFRQSRFLLQLDSVSRISIGARSVSSVQWVGFNDHMDYRHCRDSSTSSLHLAVANRASSHYTESTPSTPKSSLFPNNSPESDPHPPENISKLSFSE